jgi:hypothetical protein
MLARIAQQDHKLPGFRAQQWFFFFVATFYLYFRWVGWDRHLSKDAGCRRSRSRGGSGSVGCRAQDFASSSTAEQMTCTRTDTEQAGTSL